MRSQKPKASTRRQSDRRALVSDAGARAMVSDISKMTKHRWQGDPKIGWPRVAAVIRGRNYYFRAEVEDLVDRFVELTASGEAKTTAPPRPFRRPKEKTAALGGPATG